MQTKKHWSIQQILIMNIVLVTMVLVIGTTIIYQNIQESQQHNKNNLLQERVSVKEIKKLVSQQIPLRKMVGDQRILVTQFKYEFEEFIDNNEGYEQVVELFDQILVNQKELEKAWDKNLERTVLQDLRGNLGVVIGILEEASEYKQHSEVSRLTKDTEEATSILTRLMNQLEQELDRVAEAANQTVLLGSQTTRDNVKALDTLLNRVTVQTFLIMGMVIFLVILFQVLFFSILHNRLKQLSQVVSSITEEGLLSQRVEEVSKDELGQLAHSFNHMLEKLEKTQSTLSKQNEDLIIANKQIKQAQLQLVQSTKLASLGEMAAGVAHELNQPLSIISLRIESIIEELEENSLEETISRLESVIQQVGRATKITNYLRSFGRDSSHTSFKRFNINQSIENAFILLNEQFKLNEVNMVQQLSDRELLVYGEPIQIEQVLTNLFTNAKDAMMSSFEKKLSIRSFSQGDQAVVEVEDTGEGIPQSVVEKIFDPFYTTKDVGKGTGLGLSISHSILEQHKGHLEVDSQQTIGTTFRIKIPLYTPSHASSVS